MDSGSGPGQWSTESLRSIGLAAYQLTPDRVRAAIAGAGLGYRDRGILARRFGATEAPQTYRAIADAFDVTVERIRQIENQALRKIAVMLSPHPPERAENGRGPLLVEELELGVRVYNCLKRYGVHRVDQLTEITREELESLPNFGKTSLQEVKDVLAARGLSLANGSRLEARVVALENEVRRLAATGAKP